MGVIHVGLLPLARKLQNTPFTSREYAFESPQNMNQMGSPFMENKEVN